MKCFQYKLMFALALMITVVVPASDVKWEDKSPHKIGFITVNGMRLHYLDWGGLGGTLLLLTGMGDTAHIYDDLAPKFTDRFRVIVLTRRGQGLSDKPETGYDTATLVEDIRLFLDGMKIQRASLVGHSLAGDELTMFAAKYPQRVQKLVYLDAAIDHSGIAAFQEDFTAIFPPFPEHDNTSLDAARTWLKKYIRVVAPAVEAALRTGYVRHDNGKLEDRTPPRVYELLAKSTQPDPAYSEVKAPALSFYADDSWPELVPKDKRERADKFLITFRQWLTVERDKFRKGVPQARIVVLPDTSHYCFIHREGEVVREMRAFLLQP